MGIGAKALKFAPPVFPYAALGIVASVVAMLAVHNAVQRPNDALPQVKKGRMDESLPGRRSGVDATRRGMNRVLCKVVLHLDAKWCSAVR